MRTGLSLTGSQFHSSWSVTCLSGPRVFRSRPGIHVSLEAQHSPRNLQTDVSLQFDAGAGMWLLWVALRGWAES